MNIDIAYFLENSQAIFFSFYESDFFAWVKFFLSIYATILIINVILVVVARGTGSDVRTLLKGVDILATSRGRMIKRWNKIIKRLESEDTSQYKAAILEADKFADEILKGIGYRGADMGERLSQVAPAHLECLDDLKQVHQISNQIIRDSNFNVGSDQVKEIISVYERFLRELEFI